MSVFALVEKGVVTNIVELESADDGPAIFGKRVKIVALADGDGATIGATWDGTAFTPPAPPMPTLEQARQQQADAISAACTGAITGGFQSAALGQAHTYPSKPTDQSNLTGAVTASIMAASVAGWAINFWCADADGRWAFAAHTAAQIQAAYADGISALQAYQARNLELQTQIAAAESVDEVRAITWKPAP
jgi:hypothetical protein